MNKTVRNVIENERRGILEAIEVKREQLQHVEASVESIRRDLSDLEAKADALKEALE